MTSTGQALGTAVQRIGTSGAGRVEEGCLSECTLILRTVLVVQRRKNKSATNQRVHGTPQETKYNKERALYSQEL